MTESLDIGLLLRWSELTLDGLAASREKIDALNVYPVPDGDTGTNLYLTFESACAALLGSEPSSLSAALTVFGRGALLGARGNSGVILSQLIRAGADQLLRGDPRRPGLLLADMLTGAADAAYAAVAQPVEGTMLTVARAAAVAAQASLEDAPSRPSDQMAHVIAAAAAAAHLALGKTTDQLEPLRRAGVVDAGGAGLCVLLDAAQEAFTGRPVPSSRVLEGPLPGPSEVHQRAPGGPQYEVMYLLDADTSAMQPLRESLAALGDSLVVVGGDQLWNVHVHVDDVGAAIESGMRAGRPHRVRVSYLEDSAAGADTWRSSGNGSGAHRRVVAVAAGDGLADLFSAAGAVVVSGGVGRRPAMGDLLTAMLSDPGTEVIVLPNDTDTLAVARAAAAEARRHGVRVAVVPTRAQVQGLAAIAVHTQDRTFDDDVVQMTSAAGHTRHGAVTVAARDAMTTAGPCRVGDALGVVEGDFAVVGHSLADAASEVVDRLLSGGGEMVTLVQGADDDGLAVHLEAYLRRIRPDVDVLVYRGGQPRYPLLIAVE